MSKQPPASFTYDGKTLSKALAKVLESILGYSSMQFTFYHLDKYRNISFDDDDASSYSLETIKDALIEIFGAGAIPLVTMLEDELRKQKT